MAVFELLLSAACIYASADSTDVDKTLQFAMTLPDVEVVGVKQLPDATLQLQTDISREEILDYRIDGVRGISEIVPNFFLPAYGSRMTSSIYVRGLGARIDQPVVGLNVDNIPYLNKDNYDFSMADIAGIEVVRGSAGVLNGRNAMAGQINIRTLSPWDFSGVRFSAGYSRANTADVSAIISGRLSASVASSLTAQFATTDGFFRNEEDNSHCGRERQGGARWKLSWHPHTRWSLSNVAAVTAGRQDGYPYENLASGRIAYGDSIFYKRVSFTDGLTVSYSGKRMVATSITSVQYLNDNMTLDQDFLPDEYFTLSQKRNEWAFTQDLFAKGTRRAYSWLFGVFGFYKKSDYDAPVTFKEDGISRLIEDNVNSKLPPSMQLIWDERRMTLGSTFDIHNFGFALYHQSSVKVANWTFQAGLRWDIERVTMDYVSRCNTSATMYRKIPTGAWMPIGTQKITIDDSHGLGQTFNEVTPQLSIEYSPVRWMDITASVAKGFKAGGYNTQMLSDILEQQIMQQSGQEAQYDIERMLTYKPEKSWTYELTLRGRTDNGRLRGELTGYFISCIDQQLTVFLENTTGRAMTNAGRTRSCGVEATASYIPVNGLTVHTSYGFTNAVFRRYDNGVTDFRGKRLPYAPSHTLFAGVEYDLPYKVFGMTPSVGVNVRAAGDIWWDDDNTERQKFYATLGAELALANKNVTVSLWGRNLTNTRYCTFYFESIGNRFVQRADPWTIGATVRVSIPCF